MSNLVPEARVNKNGVSVIKHVRPDQGVSASKLAAPAPSLQTTKSARGYRTLMDLTERISSAMNMPVKARVKKYSVSTLEIIDDYDQNVRKLTMTDLNYILSREEEDTVREYYRFAVDAKESTDDTLTVIRCIRGVKYYYPDQEIPDLTRTPLEFQETVRPLIRIASIIHSWMEEEHPAAVQEHDSITKEIVNIIGDKELVRLIQENPERGEAIANFILDREVVDTGLIREVLEGDVPRALYDGAL